MRIDKSLSNIFLKFRKKKLFLVFITTISTILSACIPFLIMDLIDAITNKLGMSEIMKVGVLITGLTIVNIIVELMQNYYWHRLRLESIDHLRIVLFERMLFKSKAYFDSNNQGKILTLIMDDSSLVAQNIVIGMPMLFSNIIHLVTILIVLYLLSKQLFIVLIFIIPIYILLFNKVNSRIRCVAKLEREEFAKVMSDAQEKIDGIDTIKVFKKEFFMQENFKKKVKKHFKFTSKNLLYQSLGNGLTNSIISLIPVIVLLYGSILISKDILTLGGLIGFFTYIAYIYEPLMNLSDYNIGVQKSIAIGENILKFLDEDNNNDTGLIDIKSFESLEFCNVSFSYNDEQEIIKDLSFLINKGDRVAIKGGSGSGKSTLIKLILRMYTPTRGKIYINNIDISKISLSSLYDIFSIQTQNLFVFDGTIKDNIVFDNSIDKNKMLNAMKSAQLYNNKYPFNDVLNIISKNSISGGQKQRVCLSRSFFKRFEVLILDEPSSSIDAQLEKELRQEIDKITKGQTLLLTSHRPCLIELCNTEINLD